MFGINEITWPDFLKFMTFSLMVWYSLLLLLGWIKSKQNTDHKSFEEYQLGISESETLQPVVVSSTDYAAEILQVNPVDKEFLPASLYEETGYDEGLVIENFIKKNSPKLAKMIPEIYHQ